jgi:hypothetical protein
MKQKKRTLTKRSSYANPRFQKLFRLGTVNIRFWLTSRNKTGSRCYFKQTSVKFERNTKPEWILERFPIFLSFIFELQPYPNQNIHIQPDVGWEEKKGSSLQSWKEVRSLTCALYCSAYANRPKEITHSSRTCRRLEGCTRMGARRWWCTSSSRAESKALRAPQTVLSKCTVRFTSTSRANSSRKPSRLDSTDIRSRRARVRHERNVPSRKEAFAIVTFFGSNKFSRIIFLNTYCLI